MKNDNDFTPLGLFLLVRIDKATTGDFKDQYEALLDQLDDGADPQTIQEQYTAVCAAEDHNTRERLKRSALRLDAVRETALVTFDDKALSEFDRMLARCHQLLDERLLTFGGSR